MRRGQLPLPVLVVLGLAVSLCDACSTSALTPGGTVGQAVPCDPLAPGPIAPGAVVGVGEDADGTLYVDAANGVFVSAGGALIRQHVLGTGQSGTNELIFTFESPSVDAGSSDRDLLVETTGGTASAMALGPGGVRLFLDQSGAGRTTLTLVDAATIAGLAAVNTPAIISYVGDAAIGVGVNIGAGSITCNYDGYEKHATVIGDGAFIGSATMLVAPVEVGANAMTAAGSAIAKDVPAGSLGIERAEQRTIEGWAKRRKSAHTE